LLGDELGHLGLGGGVVLARLDRLPALGADLAPLRDAVVTFDPHLPELVRRPFHELKAPPARPGRRCGGGRSRRGGGGARAVRARGRGAGGGVGGRRSSELSPFPGFVPLGGYQNGRQGKGGSAARLPRTAPGNGT